MFFFYCVEHFGIVYILVYNYVEYCWVGINGSCCRSENFHLAFKFCSRSKFVGVYKLIQQSVAIIVITLNLSFSLSLSHTHTLDLQFFHAQVTRPCI